MARQCLRRLVMTCVSKVKYNSKRSKSKVAAKQRSKDSNDLKREREDVCGSGVEDCGGLVLSRVKNSTAPWYPASFEAQLVS